MAFNKFSSREITLLPAELRVGRENPFVSKILPVVLFAYIFLAVVLGGLFFIFSRAKTEATRDRDSQVAAILAFKESESAQLVVKDRLKTLVGIGSSKPTFRSVLDTVVASVVKIPGLGVVEVSGDAQRIFLSVRAPDSFLIEGFTREIKDEIEGIQFEDLNREEDGGYVVSLVIPLIP